MKKQSKPPQFSESIGAFCRMMEDAQKDYAWNYSEVNRIIEKRICAVASGQRTTGTAASISPTHLAFPAFSLIGREKSGSPVLPIIVRRFTSAGTMLKKMPLWHGSQKRLSFIGSSPLKKHSWGHLVFAPTELWHKAIGVELQDGTYR